MKIVDIKTKIIPSNPRSKNYPIGYPGGIASNSNGVTPDLSIYLLKEIWERNFEERTDEYGNEYLYIRKPLAIGGGATMYASNGVVVPSIFDGLPLDNTTIRKNPETGLIEVIGGTGTSFDENAMWSALSGSSDNQINKSHLTNALAGYATESWVTGKGYATESWVASKNYATTEALNAVSNKLNDFLEGSDTDNIINKWKELEAFLSGMAETDNLAEILRTKADRSYVDSTFVTLATKQTITGEKTFSSLLNTAAIKASGSITAPSLAASDWVTIAGIKLRKLEDGALMLEGNLALTGALTMYASNGQSFDTIYDGLPIDNDTIYWQEVDGSRVLKAREGSGSSFDKSAMWAALEGATTEQINKTHLTTALNGYATESWVTSKNYLTSVSIATISDLHANWDALLKAAPSAYVTRWPTISEVTGKQNLIVKLNGGTTEGTNQFTYNATGAKTINITPAGIGSYTKSESDSKYPTKTGSGASGTWGINVTGNAGSATKLQTARTLWGQSFDGTANISGDITLTIGKGIYLSANDERWLLQTKRSDNTQINGIKTNGFQMCTYFGNTKTMQFGSDEIHSYVDFRAEKDLYINGIRLHKTADGVITLEGNLAVTGGITMYAIDPVSASTIMDGVAVDGTTIAKVDGVLKVLNAGGGEAGSVAWGNISGKPSVFATNIANITDLHSSWDSVLAAQKPAWITAVSIATISDLHANWDALLKAAPSSYVTRWPSFAEVTSKPSTLSGYGITDAYAKADADGRYVNTSGDTMSGQLVADGGIYLGYGKAIQSSYTHLLKTGYEDGAGDYFEIGVGGDNGVKMYLRGINNGTLVWNGNTVWNAANSNRSDANWSCYTLNASRINSSECVNCAKIGYNTSDSKDGIPWYGMGYGNNNVMTFSGYGGVNIRTAFGNNVQFASNGLSYFYSHVLIKGSSRLSFDDYGGGWYMQDVNWVRVYGDKSIYTGGAIQCGGYVYTGTGFRINYGTNSAFINVNWDGNKGDFVTFHTPGNNNQWFVMELWSNGNVYTNGNFLAVGGSTFYGSDIRYKSIIQQVELSLLAIANAPSFVYHWNKKGMKCDRLNLGGSAQYTQSVLPWAVEDNDNFLSMDYATVAYTFAVHTARHLLTYETRTDKKIKKLENRVKYLEKQLKKLGYEEVRTLDDQSV